MAFIKDYNSVGNTSTTGLTGVLPNHTADDLLVLIIAKRGITGTFTTPTGYTLLREDSFSNTKIAFFYKVATGSESAPVSSSGVTSEHWAYMLSVADVDTTTPIDTSAISQVTNTNHTSAAVTTGSSNTLNLWIFAGDTNQFPLPFPDKMVLKPSTVFQFDGILAWKFQRTAGASDTCTINKASNNDGQIMTVAINSSGTPVVPPQVDDATPASTVIFPMYINNTSIWGGNNYNLTTDVPTIDGDTTATVSIFSGAVSTSPIFKYNGTLINYSAGIGNRATGCRAITTGNLDLSGKKIAMHIVAPDGQYASRTGLVADKSVYVGLRSGSSPYAYRWFNAAAKNSLPDVFGIAPVVVDVDETTNIIQENGTFDSTDVSGICIGFQQATAAEGRINFSQCHFLNTATVIDGSASRPAKLETFVDIVQSADIDTIATQRSASSSQFYSVHNLQIGNGSDAVYFEDSGKSLEFPALFSESARRVQYNASANDIGLTLYGVSGDTIRLRDSTISGSGEWNFTIHASSTSAATWDFNGLIIVNALVTLRDIFTALSGVTFRGCAELVTNGADLSGGCTIDATKAAQAITITGATQAALQTALDNLANCTLSNNSTVALRVAYTGTGNISLNFDGITFTGNTVDIHYNSTNASALTAVMQNGSNATTSAISGSATSVTISNDVTFTVNINVSGAELTILATGTTTEEHHVESAGTSENFVFTAPLGNNVDIQVFKPGYEPFWESNRDLGSADSSINVALVAVPAYEG